MRTADEVVPLFVLDESILGSDYAAPNRLRFLHDSLVDLDLSLRERGGALVLRRGDVVSETMRVIDEVGAEGLFMSRDVSAHAQERERRFDKECDNGGESFQTFSGINVIDLDDVSPQSGNHYKVFTPYLRRWRTAPRRSVLEAPSSVKLPLGIERGRIPSARELLGGREVSPELIPGGEIEGRARLTWWLRTSLATYEDHNNDLAGDKTSKLSPFLHFGCLSPREIEQRAAGREGGDALIRQLAWRDFFHQVNEAVPTYPHRNYKSRGDRWRQSEQDFEAWTEGRTGYPIVDAGMRQLKREGWMHNRARLITASFLVKDLYIDWRKGAQHFWDWLVDGDIANNAGNWQWVAGTGNDTRPNRVFNPLRQAERFDPDGDYVRRYVEELRDIEGKAVHQPWELDEDVRASLDYPDPIVDHADAVERFRSNRN